LHARRGRPRETEIKMMDLRRAIGCWLRKPRGPGAILPLLLAVLATFAMAGETSENPDEAVRIRRVKSKGCVRLFVENRAACDVTVTLRVLTSNGRVSRIKPETATYPAYSETEAARISAEDPAKRWKWRCRFNWVQGACKPQKRKAFFIGFPLRRGDPIVWSRAIKAS